MRDELDLCDELEFETPVTGEPVTAAEVARWDALLASIDLGDGSELLGPDLGGEA